MFVYITNTKYSTFVQARALELKNGYDDNFASEENDELIDHLEFRVDIVLGLSLSFSLLFESLSNSMS